MPENVCDECGETLFECRDGFHYCSCCGTQSQNFRETEREAGPPVSVHDAQSSATKPKQTMKVKKVHVQHFTKYIRYEAYTYVLRVITEDVISNGAPTSIRAQVLHLWKCLLKRTISTVSVPKRMQDGKLRRSRIVLRPGDQYFIPGSKLRAKNDRAIKREAMDDEDTLENNDPSTSTVKSPRADTEDVPCPVTVKTPPADDTFEELNVFGVLSQAKDETEEKPEQKVTSEDPLPLPFSAINIHYLISLVYVACTRVGAKLLFSDIVRWARCGAILSKEAWSVLPDEYYSSVAKNSLVQTGSELCELTSFMWYCCCICSTLEISMVPSLGIEETIARLLVDLNLPGELESRIEILLGMERPLETISAWEASVIAGRRNYEVLKGSQLVGKWWPVSVPLDVKAMSYILLALKFLFCLDDRTEHDLSDIAESCNAASNYPCSTPDSSNPVPESDDKKLMPPSDAKRCFVFSKWLRQSLLRQAVLSGESPDQVLRKDWFPLDMTALAVISEHVSLRPNRKIRYGADADTVARLLNDTQSMSNVSSGSGLQEDVSDQETGSHWMRCQKSIFPLRTAGAVSMSSAPHSDEVGALDDQNVDLFGSDFVTTSLDYLHSDQVHGYIQNRTDDKEKNPDARRSNSRRTDDWTVVAGMFPCIGLYERYMDTLNKESCRPGKLYTDQFLETLPLSFIRVLNLFAERIAELPIRLVNYMQFIEQRLMDRSVRYFAVEPGGRSD